MSIKHILTFTREPIDCDMAESMCPVHKPCNRCNEHFNSLPIWTRAIVEVPRRYTLFTAFGWKAFMSGSGTFDQFRVYRNKLNKARKKENRRRYK